MFNDLGKRFLFSVLAILFTAVLLYFAPWIMWLVSIVIAAIAALALNEYIQIVKNKGVALHTSSMLTASSLFILFSAFFIFVNLHYFVWANERTTKFLLFYLSKLPIFLLFFIPLITAFIQHVKSPDGFIAKASFSILGIFYIVIPLHLLLHFLYFPALDGRMLVVWIIAATKFSDMAAYFAGRLLGKHKMAPIASPNKSWEGCVAGITASILISLLFSIFIKYNGFMISTAQALIAGLFFGIGAQFGDIFESLLKRDAKVKDSSSLPGLGGVLDTLDSLIANLYFAYFFLSLILGFV